jgi:hypothetical protein
MGQNYRTATIVAVAGAAVLAPLAVAVAELCSGQVEASVKCAQEQSCKIDSDPRCATLIVSNTVEMCTSSGALPADNCRDTTTELPCAMITDCEVNATGTACVLGSFLGYVSYHVPTDGGDCELE